MSNKKQDNTVKRYFSPENKVDIECLNNFEKAWNELNAAESKLDEAFKKGDLKLAEKLDKIVNTKYEILVKINGSLLLNYKYN